MKLKSKILIGAIVLVALPVVVLTGVLSTISASSSFDSLEQASKERLVAIRALTKGRIEDYLATIDKQIQSYSSNRMIINAMGSFTLAYQDYSAQTNQDITKARLELSRYYEQEFNQKYQQLNNGTSADTTVWLANLSDNSLLLQHQLIEKNQQPLGSKHLLTDLGNRSDYNKYHQLYHPIISDYLAKFEYYDIFLVDINSDQIVYSVFKELDFATSLKDGSFAKSSLANVYLQAKASNEPDFIAVSDFSNYSPSYQASAAFIASPIFDHGVKVGVLVFQMPIGNINKIMTHQQQWRNAGLGQSGETYLVGRDKTLRSQNRFMLENKSEYLAALSKANIEESIIQTIDLKGTAIGIQPVKSRTLQLALSGQSGIEIVSDYRNIKVLSAYAPMTTSGLNWVILAEIDADEAFASAYVLSDKIKFYSLVLGGILLVVGGGAGLIFSRTISRPIIVLSDAITKIEQDSDLTYRIKATSHDEIGEATNSLSSMVDKFHSGISDVATNAIKISASAQLTSQVCIDNNERLDVQRDQTSMVAVAMEQMTATVEEVSNNLSLSMSAINKVNQQSHQGRQLMNETVDSINDVEQQIDKATQIIHSFETHSIEIMTVLEVIKSVADQTNLLALNAAIEAARAGEQGRGFAVVADEVRALASRTQASTVEINQVIDKFKISTQQAVDSMDKSQTLVKNSVNKAQLAGDNLTSVASAVDDINEMNIQIAAAVEEQRATSEEINRNVMTISTMTNDTSDGSQAIVNASSELLVLVDNMNKLVEKFKI
ncbi:MAG: methyl-accepting chemotaxis protein [Gammaproteobacteria bacterium]|nr:methyl-accepting chemotaxis protein [Gammaproteobacteria bacterium]